MVQCGQRDGSAVSERESRREVGQGVPLVALRRRCPLLQTLAVTFGLGETELVEGHECGDGLQAPE